jgi:AraC-like DNA-binding protein
MRSRGDQATSARRGCSPFDAEFQRFIGLCQVQAALAGKSHASLDDSGARLVEALPRPRSGAEFLMLRSVLVEFAARALQGSDIDRSGAILPLAQIQPAHGDLAGTFLRCLRAAAAPQLVAPIALGQLRVDRAMSVITARLAEPALSAGSVAASIGVSEQYLTKLLHTHCKCGFRAVVRHTRLKAACARLEHSLDRIKEVAASVGYSSTSQFDRDFRRAYHLTPGLYRRQQYDAIACRTAAAAAGSHPAD